MSDIHIRHARRADESFFDPRNYYLMMNTNFPGQNLGIGGAETDTTRLFDYNTTETENWQFFYQEDHWYIRNYHTGADSQLGITPGDRLEPKMRTKGGDLGQQWTVFHVGTEFVLMNALYGQTANLSLRSNSPAGLYSDIGGDRWNITMNAE